MPRGDPATILVDVEHHDLDFVAELHDLVRVDVLVRPVHLRHVDEPLHPFLDLDEAAVVGDVRHAPEQPRALGISPRDVHPRIGPELLQPERYPRALAIEPEHLDLDLVADIDDLGRVLDPLPRHVGDVQQAVDPSEVHECAVVGQVLHDTGQHGSLLEALEQRFALGGVLLLDHRAPRDDHVVAAAIELDHLEVQRLAFEVGGIAHRAHVDERPGQECTDVVDVDSESALDLAVDDPGTVSSSSNAASR